MGELKKRGLSDHNPAYLNPLWSTCFQFVEQLMLRGRKMPNCLIHAEPRTVIHPSERLERHAPSRRSGRSVWPSAASGLGLGPAVQQAQAGSFYPTCFTSPTTAAATQWQPEHQPGHAEGKTATSCHARYFCSQEMRTRTVKPAPKLKCVDIYSWLKHKRTFGSFDRRRLLAFLPFSCWTASQAPSSFSLMVRSPVLPTYCPGAAAARAFTRRATGGWRRLRMCRV